MTHQPGVYVPLRALFLVALGFGPGRIGTLVSMATNSSHRVIMGKMLCPL